MIEIYRAGVKPSSHLWRNNCCRETGISITVPLLLVINHKLRCYITPGRQRLQKTGVLVETSPPIHQITPQNHPNGNPR